MESEYYEIKILTSDFIAHKSCKFDGKYFSDAKFIRKEYGISVLEKRCELVDKITENINLPIDYLGSMCSHNGCYIYLSVSSTSIHYYDVTYSEFKNYDELYEYISQNEPNLIIDHDIKIAIKD